MPELRSDPLLSRGQLVSPAIRFALTGEEMSCRLQILALAVIGLYNGCVLGTAPAPAPTPENQQSVELAKLRGVWQQTHLLYHGGGELSRPGVLEIFKTCLIITALSGKILVRGAH